METSTDDVQFFTSCEKGPLLSNSGYYPVLANFNFSLLSSVPHFSEFHELGVESSSSEEFRTYLAPEQQAMDEGELEGYRAQLSAIEAELAICSEPCKRAALLESKADIEELISLLTEGDAMIQSGRSNEDEFICLEASSPLGGTPVSSIMGAEEIIGQHCRAPYKRIVDRALRFHDAVVLDFANNESDINLLKVRVLYSYPLENAMKPCEYFLDDRCTYGAECRFSHGEEVLFSDLLDYVPPDFSKLKEGSLVLSCGENKLWRSARIVAVDGEQLAVRLLSTGKEIATVTAKVVPLEEEEDAEEESTNIPTTSSWPELKGQANGRVKVGDMGDWEKHTRGIGMKLLLKMGYRVGEGLGRNSDGIVHAIQPVVYSKNKSLDVCMERKKKFVDGINSKKERVKKEMAKRMHEAAETCDIFDIINRNLASNLRSDEVEGKEEKKYLKESSSRGLGVQSLNLEREMKELKARERKLRDGIVRNQRDHVTADKLKKSLHECQENLKKLASKQNRLTNEIEGRKSRKDFF